MLFYITFCFKKTPLRQHCLRGEKDFAVPLSFITQVQPDDVGQPEGVHIPRAPGRTFRTAPRDGLQPVTVPLLAKLWCVLFPIHALFGYH